MKKYLTLICFIFLFFTKPFAQVSFNMNLLDQWDQVGLNYNDCWGYVDGSNNEYAILGSYDKIHFFQITSNNDLVLVDEFTPGANTIWRDFKTYGNFAYAVADQGSEGLLVYDLSNLPTSVSLAHEITSEFTRAHNIYIDEPNGKLYVAGANTRGNGLIVYDVTTDPPTFLASVPLPGGGYVHDLYVKNNTAYCSHGNNGFYIWDMSTPTSPSFLASFTGEQGYNHSSWVTPDGNTAFYAREVGVGLPMTALDISDYSDLEVISNFKFPLLAPTHVDNVPHNPYLVGNYLYTSYYEDGVQVFDVSDPANVTQLAYYDTYPSNTQYNGYEGCWGVYPFLPSGRILGSDGTNGLFLLELDISSNPPLVLNIINLTDVLCNGDNMGSIEVTATGGVAPYTYSLDGGTPQSSGTFTNLSAGTYTLAIIDAVGVIKNTPIIISEPTAIFPSIALVQNVTCFGDSDGTMIAQAAGGTVTTSYQYSIDGVNFSPNNTFTNLSAGAYNLSVRDNNNCIATIGFNINQPDELISFVNTLTDVDCFGNNNGEVTFFTLGGTPSFSFSINQIDFQPTSTFNNLAGGNYTLYTIDANGCEWQTPFTIAEPPLLQISIAQQTNLNCFGENIGEVILNGQGGTAGLEYNVNNGTYQSSSTFGNLAGGNYDFNIKDGNGCIASVSTTVTSPTELVVNVLQVTHVDCFEENTGSVSFDISGGAGNYSTTFNGNTQTGNSIVIENLSAGNYALAVADGNGCTNNQTIVINENPEFEIFPFNIQNPTCNNASDGVIEIFPLGGSGAFTYSINNSSPSSNPVFENLAGGTYNLSAIDNLGCEALTQIQLVEPAPILVNLVSQNNVNCGGTNDGSVTLSASGGVGVLEYFLNGTSNTSGVFNNLAAGNYTAIISDENDCIEGINFTITVPSTIVAQVANQTNIDCNGNTTGSFQVTASGGNSNYTFDIGSTANTNGFFENLGAGSYNISITDGNNCQTIISTELTQPSIITSNITSTQDVNCFGGNNGSVQIQANGGTGALSFILGNETNTTGLFQNLSSGNYNIIITDANNCQNFINATISEPAELTSSVAFTQDINCFGGNNGSVQIQANGGTGALSFILGNETNTTGFFENLSSGNYNIIITDANNCQITINTTISEPAQLTPSVASTQDVNCFGGNNGSVQVQSNGGTGVLSFVLGNETNTTGFFENLSSGNYNIIITDSNSCQNTINATILEPTEIISSIASTQDVNCFGGNNGSVQIQSNGGTGTLNFTLGNETNTAGFFENLSVGNYNISITDANNCQSIINTSISEPNELTSSIASTQDVNCFGENNGSVQIQSNGGTGALNFTLGNETNATGFFENLSVGNYNISITDENNCQNIINTEITEPSLLTILTTNIQLASCNGQQGAIQVEAQGGILPYQFSNGSETNSDGFFENLMAGIYLINVTDGNNCTTNVEVNITEPNALNVEIVQTQNPNCNGENSGSIQLNAVGGTGVVNYTLGNETNNSGLFGNLATGFYNTTITDGNGCASQVEIELVGPPLIEIEIIQLSKNNCFGDANGSVSLGATGGTGALVFSLGNETNATGFFENLSAGNYTTTVIDENNCQNTIPFIITEPLVLTANISQNNSIGCFGEQTGSVQFNAEGGTGNYLFSMNGETNLTGLFENLDAGNATMTLTDDNGCSFSQEIIITEPSPLIIDFSISQTPICNGDFLGLAVTATGGVGNYQFTINNESNGNGDFQNLLAGTYLAIVTDGNACTNELEITINEPPAISITTTQIQGVNCTGENSGSVLLTASGGTGVLEYTLNNITNTTGSFENLPVGSFTYLITDENNCTFSSGVIIDEPMPLVTNVLQNQNIACFGEATGSIAIQATGGTSGYTFTLNGNTNTVGLFENLPSGTYEVIVNDANNCESIETVTLVEANELTLEIQNIQPAGCDGAATGSFQIQANGGTGNNYSYTANNQTTTNGFFENISAGVYDCVVTDENNCTTILQITVSENSDLVLNNLETINIDCFGNNSGSAQVFTTGGTGMLTYTLDTMSNTTGVFDNLSPGDYNIIVADDANCSSIFPIEILEPSELVANADTIENVDCFGATTGAVHLNATGGVGDYDYFLDGNSSDDGWFENLFGGNYSAMVVDSNNCSTTFDVEVLEPTELLIDIDDLTNDLGNGEGSITLSVSGGTPDYLYSLDGINFQSENIFENLVAGEYTIFVKDLNGCITSNLFTIEMETAISNLKLGIQEIQISPNPFSEKIIIQLDLITPQNLYIELRSISGKNILQKKSTLDSGQQNVILDVESNVPSGIYILSIRNEEQVIGHFKIIKNN